MPGEAKRKYDAETVRLSKSLTRPLSLIVETLKPGYSREDLLKAFRYYYPYEWDLIGERYKVYKGKDKFLAKHGKKKRYNSQRPEEYFYSLPKVKYLLSDEFRKRHVSQYDESKRMECESSLKNKRMNKNNKKKTSIKTYTKEQQKVDPGFIDALVYAYHIKGISINEKFEICKEIRKYDCDKTWEFFWKLNDSEKNNQIRGYAFQCLQKSGHYVKLRKNFSGKKKQYTTEKSTFEGTPESLAIKLANNGKSIQKLKSYDLFISHSYLDREIVYDIVRKINKCGLNCYVDWTADSDFLKRSLVSDFTREVLKARMKNSRKLLFLSSSNSRASCWVDFELKYYQEEVQNEIYMIVLDGEDAHNFIKIDQKKIESFFV
ncbi:MAG: toll/interleukin-1 receptor domain-containing protein [Lachnospiraceae bacterium]|nr:toll/interleukin-1 receptor domain-containing protein [Lachnospiraceae bacterium]